MRVLRQLPRKQQGIISRVRTFARFGKTLHNVEGIVGGHLRGWVFRPNEPRRRFWVAAETVGHVTYGFADIYRADVHRAQIGSLGYCGFAIPLSEHCPEPTSVMIVDDGRLRRIATVHPSARTPDRFETLGDFCFSLDPGEARLAGWLSSTKELDGRRRIVLRVDGEVVCRQVACLYRRWSPSNAADGFHGFSVPVPAAGRRLELLDDASGLLLYALRR